VLTLYALSAAPEVAVPPARATYEMVLAAMQGRILASTDLSVVYTRGGNGDGKDEAPPPRPGPRNNNNQEPPPP